MAPAAKKLKKPNKTASFKEYMDYYLNKKGWSQSQLAMAARLNQPYVNKLINAKGINVFSFDNFSFENFSFDTGFANSYSVKANERNFNFIMFRFVSDNDSNCVVNTFTIIYKINKANKGVK